MTKRIFRSIFLASSAVLLACFVIILGVMYEYFTSLQQTTLRAQATLAAQGVEKEGLAYFDGLDAGRYRLTWIAADGTVNVRIMYDHRVLDGSMVARTLGRMEEMLLGPVLDELKAMASEGG